jgi:hypothetical protein
MTARSHETIRVGLRRIIRDQSVRPSMRMDAIKMLMRVEGLMEEAGSAKKKPAIHHMSNVNSKGLEELLKLAEQEKAG